MTMEQSYCNLDLEAFSFNKQIYIWLLSFYKVTFFLTFKPSLILKSTKVWLF